MYMGKEWIKNIIDFIAHDEKLKVMSDRYKALLRLERSKFKSVPRQEN